MATPTDTIPWALWEAHHDAGTIFRVAQRPGFFSRVWNSPRRQQGNWAAYRLNNDPVIIEIYDDVDVFSAVVFLNEAMVETMGDPAVRLQINNTELANEDPAQILTLANQQMFALFNEFLKHGVETAKFILGAVSTPVDILITTTDALDGETSWWSVGFSCVPLLGHLHLPIKLVTKTAREEVFRLSGAAVARLKEAIDIALTALPPGAVAKGLPAMRRRTKILAVIDDAYRSGLLTEEEMVEFIAYLRRNFPDAIPVRVDSSTGAKVLAENLDLAGLPKPTGITNAHHNAMQKFDEYFVRVGIDIHRAMNGSWVDEALHSQYHSIGMSFPFPNGPVRRFDDVVTNFFQNQATTPKTRTEIDEFLQQLREAFP